MNDAHTLFLSGLDLGERFYWRVVRPILDDAYPDLPHSAALIGSGSEVLGLDTARSTDHEWGPRVLIFLSNDDADRLAEDIVTMLAERLPPSFLGYSTHFGPIRPDGSRVPRRHAGGPINHKVEVHGWRSWMSDWIGRDPTKPWSAADWLSVSQQRLLEVTAGRVFHDPTDDLSALRDRLAFYPDGVWRYLLACQWSRISQHEAFVGRTREVGDELGSRVVAAGLARDLMRLWFLLNRRYAPYAKWLGSAFVHLPESSELQAALTDSLGAPDWQTRETRLGRALELAARRHNTLGLTAALDPASRPYHERPYQVLHAERFVATLDATIVDPALREIINRAGWVGSVDQVSDNVDVLTHQERAWRVGHALHGWDTTSQTLSPRPAEDQPPRGHGFVDTA